MRAKLIGGLVGATLLVPSVASAQEVDPCYVDPASVECSGVGGSEAEPDDVTNGGTNGESEEPGIGGAGEAAGQDEVDVEVLSNVLTAGELPRTGSEVLIGVGLGLGLLGVGTVALVASRRRRTTA